MRVVSTLHLREPSNEGVLKIWDIEEKPLASRKEE